jgi:hypothetical protein
VTVGATASVVGLTVNGTTNATTADVAQFISQVPSGTETNVIYVNTSGAGTVTNGINITQTTGTLTNGLTIGTVGTNYIKSTNFVVVNTGNILTVSGAAVGHDCATASCTIAFGATNANLLNIGTGTTSPTINIGTAGSGTPVIKLGTGLSTAQVLFYPNTANPALATNGQFALGTTGAGNSSGRIWIRVNNLNFRFSSVSNAVDYSEYLQQDNTSEPGDVMVVANSGYETVKRSAAPYDNTIVGVVSRYGTSNNNGSCEDEVSCDRTHDSHWTNVGMLGQVYTKISTENGNIASGDPLTSSSLTGVAMKATKPGRIVGYALDTFDGSTSGKDLFPDLPIAPVYQATVTPSGGQTTTVSVGKIIIYLQPGWWEPETPPPDPQFIQIVGPEGGGSSDTPKYGLYNKLTGTTIGTYTVAKDAVIGNLNSGLIVSKDIFTDALSVRGKSTFAAPLLLTDPTANQAAIMQIANNNGVFSIGTADNPSLLTVDSNGDVVIQGTLTVNRLKAGSIDGLDVLADKITTLSAFVSSLASESATFPAASQSGQTASVSPSLFGDLTASGSSTFTGQTVFRALVTFIEDIVIQGQTTVNGLLKVLGDISIFGHIAVNTDTAGVAVIPRSTTSVDVPFDKPFTNPPIVTISLVLPEATDSAFLAEGVQVAVTNVSTTGFTILVNQPVPRDLMYNWFALAVNNGRKVVGKSADGSAGVNMLLVTPTPTILSETIVTPSATLTLTPTLTPTPSPTLTPTATPVPTPTPTASGSGTLQ